MSSSILVFAWHSGFYVIPFCEQESAKVLFSWMCGSVGCHCCPLRVLGSVEYFHIVVIYGQYNVLYLVQVDLAIELLEDLLGIIQVEFSFAFNISFQL